VSKISLCSAKKNSMIIHVRFNKFLLFRVCDFIPVVQAPVLVLLYSIFKLVTWHSVIFQVLKFIHIVDELNSINPDNDGNVTNPFVCTWRTLLEVPSPILLLAVIKNSYNVPPFRLWSWSELASFRMPKLTTYMIVPEKHELEFFDWDKVPPIHHFPRGSSVWIQIFSTHRYLLLSIGVWLQVQRYLAYIFRTNHLQSYLTRNRWM
jgi:hypothetical protein